MRIYGHRGASARAPENTVLALERAIEDGADGAEVDVRLTLDGTPVLMHDADFSRALGVKATVRETHSLLVHHFANGLVPTLAEALAATRGALPLNLELKAGPGDRDLPKMVVAELRRAGRIRDTLVSSFAPRLVLAARALAPSLRIGVILAAPLRGLPRLDADVFSIEAKAVDAAVVEAAHARGAEVHVWTVNRTTTARRLAALGVDVVISDDPGALRRKLGNA